VIPSRLTFATPHPDNSAVWATRTDDKLISLGRRVAIYLFAAAFAVHLCYLCQYARTPFFWAPELDSLYDDLTAKAIAAGHVDHQAFFRAPLYGYFLAGIYKLFGHSYWAARLVQAAIGSGSVVLCYRLGSRVFRPTVGLVAASMMALYGPLVFNDGELHTPVLEVFLDLLVLNLTLPRADIPAQGCRHGAQNRMFVAAGLILGLSAVTRPSILVVVPIVLCWVSTANSHPNTGRAGRPSYVRNGVIAAALFLAGAAFFPTLVTVRNWRVSGDPVFIASQGGINLYLGNRPGADGFTPSTPTRYRFNTEYEDSVALYGRRAAEDAAGHPLTASQAQSYWVKRVIDWWRVDTGAAVKLTLRKVLLAWTHTEIRNNTAYAFARRELAPFLWICAAGFWLAGPLGVMGMALGYRHPGARRLTVFTLVYIASFVPFFMADRYRLPVVPLLLLLGAYAVVRISELVTVRSWSSTAIAFATVFLASVLVDIDWVHTETPKTWAIDYWSEGNRYVRLEKFPEAEAAYRKALILDPRNGDIWNGLGEAQYDEGRPIDAAVSFATSARIGPDVERAQYNEAICREAVGDIDGARRLLVSAVALDPTYDRARVALAHLRLR